ncbi:alpha beta-hydrolase [Pisolithus orientalis]|uniref:alpha beta-hydrolase n=1 Tax=Pisolithus orientalis TaxID=936130 RepID=UPI0022242E31|nr:alpha beta-hydrolase [Pisolithus orientalis]KAI6030838.1 alpha beta-hydrolase [Pisolithus orientalis]
MNSVSFPIQLVTFIRRLVNVISTISLTNHYLFPRIQVENRLSEHQARPGIGPYSPLLDSSLNDRWDWLRPAYKGSVSPSETSLHASEALEFQSSISVSITKVVASSSSPNVDLTTQDAIHRLMSNPTLFDPIRTPRYPIVLCHGLYGFDARGPSAFPSLRYHYWSNVLAILKKKIGAEVIVTAVPGTGSIAARAEALDRILQQRATGRGVNLMAHSMGGLDCRHLITHIKPTDYVPLSLTSISTPHRGSPFMDWCAQNLGLGRRTDSHVPECNDASSNSDSDKHEFVLSLASLPSSFTTLILSYLDSPAYANLTTSYLNDIFNPSTPDDPRVKYFSVVSRIDEMNIWHPLWLPKMVLDDAERKAKELLKARMGGKYSGEGVPPWEQDDQWGNDGLVTVQSARWGEFLGILEGCDHWDIRSWGGSLTEFSIGLPSVSIPLSGLTHRAGADGWSLGDWTRFIGAWRKQDKGTEAGLQMSTVMSQADALPLSSLQETKSEREERKQRDETDPVVKASTDKLSAVFDWIVEQVPPPGKPSSPNSQPQSEKPARRDLVTKMDLERFYISLTRKLYDEGL